MLQAAGHVHGGDHFEGQLVDAVVLVAADIEDLVAGGRLER